MYYVAMHYNIALLKHVNDPIWNITIPISNIHDLKIAEAYIEAMNTNL